MDYSTKLSEVIARAPPALSVSSVAIVGLGYVGLPLAVALGRILDTIGYDLSEAKVAAYRRFTDPYGEVPEGRLRAATKLRCTTDPSFLRGADLLIVAVPTPVDKAKQPDFRPLVSASETVGRNMKRGATVVFESTVYPGATEEICVPILEECSGMKWKRDFNVGYSPERMNPGDKIHTLERIVKVVAGDTPETLERVASLYSAVVEAGVFRASSIRVAEAAKVIENTQRDLNIALMNELALICDRMGLDTLEVLEAAGTKWNFLPFRPGLVGGHCIGVDPYYLTHKAEMIGYRPQVILAGRRINDGMGNFLAEKAVKLISQCGTPIAGAKVNILGVTFKEDCADLRNSKVADLVRELRSFGVQVKVHDPLAHPADAHREYGIELMPLDNLTPADALIVAVAHRDYRCLTVERIRTLLMPGRVLMDLKGILDRDALQDEGFRVWRL